MKKLLTLLTLFAILSSASAQEEIRYKLEDWSGSSTDYANLQNGYIFTVGLGGGDIGFGFAGLEIKNPGVIQLNLLASADIYRRLDAASFAGFILDYSTPKGYTKRVMLSVGMSDPNRKAGSPSWGTPNGGNQIVDIGIQPFYSIDPAMYAPADWDGKIWFTVGVQNTGANSALKVKMTKPFN
jgi:hypothetical protein